MVNKYANPETVLGLAYRSSQSQPTHCTHGNVVSTYNDVNISVNLYMATLNMKKFSDSQIDLLISLWHSEPCLWDSTKATYCNADASRMSKELDSLSIIRYRQLPVL